MGLKCIALLTNCTSNFVILNWIKEGPFHNEVIDLQALSLVSTEKGAKLFTTDRAYQQCVAKAFDLAWNYAKGIILIFVSHKISD